VPGGAGQWGRSGELPGSLPRPGISASFDVAAPSPVAYQQGREALLERLAAGSAQPDVLPPLVARDGRWRLSDLLAGFSLSRLQTPLSRVAAAFAALFLLGGAIGVSAAAGLERRGPAGSAEERRRRGRRP
jgi:hypothetical protein